MYDNNIICEQCNGPDICTKCAAGYVLSDATCVPCEGKSCAKCDIFTNTCSQCLDGFYLDDVDNSCKPCTGACLKCSSADTCDLCEGDGDYAQSDGNGGCECISGWDTHPSIEFGCKCNKPYIT